MWLVNAGRAAGHAWDRVQTAAQQTYDRALYGRIQPTNLRVLAATLIHPKTGKKDITGDFILRFVESRPNPFVVTEHWPADESAVLRVEYTHGRSPWVIWYDLSEGECTFPPVQENLRYLRKDDQLPRCKVDGIDVHAEVLALGGPKGDFYKRPFERWLRMEREWRTGKACTTVEKTTNTISD